MSIDEDAYNLDALPLARLPWPAEVPRFDGAVDDDEPRLATSSAIEILADERVRAARWTCRLPASQLREPSSVTRPIIVSLIDADPAVSLQLYWSLREGVRFAAAFEWLRASFASAILAIPDDLPSRFRVRLPRVGARTVDASYPAGNRRLLPRALKLPADTPVLDGLALLDAYVVATRGDVPAARPIAIAAGSIDYRVVDRGTAVGSLLASDADGFICAGPRLRERAIPPDARVDDGELTFHLVPRLVAPQSPCVRCGWCVHACPTRCDPVALMRLAQEPSARRARSAGLASCIDCGICTAVCPSRLPLHGLIDSLRARLADGGGR